MSDVILLSGAEAELIGSTLVDAGSEGVEVKVWIDPLDHAFKVKLANRTWSPPMGTVAR